MEEYEMIQIQRPQQTQPRGDLDDYIFREEESRFVSDR